MMGVRRKRDVWGGFIKPKLAVGFARTRGHDSQFSWHKRRTSTRFIAQKLPKLSLSAEAKKQKSGLYKHRITTIGS